MRHIIASLAFIIISSGLFAASVAVVKPQCCYLDNPLGIETPAFGWQISADRRGAGQSAWELIIASSPARIKQGKADVWNSGKRLSDSQSGICPENVAFFSGKTYWWKVRIWDEKGKPSAWSEVQHFTMGLLEENDWSAEWITYDWTEDSRMPYFRKEIALKGNIERAIAYVCGLGAGDLFVNGEYADSTRILDPAQTNYDSYALYSAIDVTGLLKPASVNCIGMMIGDGWFNQNKVFADFSYGRPMLRVQLAVEYKDGSSEVFGTDESWLWKEGPVVKANIYSGEVYDARLEVRNWAEPGLDDTGWKTAKQAENGVPPILYSQVMPPVRMHETLPAKKIWKGKDGKWIYDFGSNNTADILLKVKLPAGTKVTVQMGEELCPDSVSVSFESSGAGVVPVQTDEYVSAGTGTETWMPRFTFHGFRYAELSVSDPSAVPGKDWLEAVVVHTDLVKKGTFECSDPQLDRLHEMALRTVQGNILGVPSDCPTREKCGWLGDSHSYVKMACDNYDMDNFLFKYLDDIRSGAQPEIGKTLHHLQKNCIFYDADKASGIPFMIAPGKRLCGVASPDWGTAVVQLPWHLYLYDGNRKALETYYDFMRRWTEYVSSLAVDHIVYQGLGDWDPPYGNGNVETPVEFSSSAFHYYDVSIMAQAAEILGKTGDSDRYSAEKAKIKEAMIAKFFNPVAKTFGSQTADAMALDMGLCPEGSEKEVAESLVNSLKYHRGFLNTGIFGLSRIGSALSRNGQGEAAFRIFTKKGLNSFEWLWKKYGATTIWEVLPFNDDNNAEVMGSSHCHPMQAGFDIWFYEDIAGIRPVAGSPGFKTVLLDPAWETDLEWAKASVDSRYGKISSSWKKEGDCVKWDFSVPAGTSALVAFPKGKKIAENGVAISGNYVKSAEKDDKDIYVFPSGSYTLTVER